jgi:4-hydroxy-tetrahydrodipicolinate synthase
MEQGADAALVVTPYYNKPTQEGLYRHFKAIADAVAIPQILYNVPSRTGCDLLPETVARLASVTNIVGLKEATGSIDRLKALQAVVGDRMDFLSGDDGTAMEFMLTGGKGVISVVANVVPTMFHQLCAYATGGQVKAAQELDNRMRPLYKVLFCEANPIPVKWALVQMSLLDDGIRLPLTPLSEDYYADVKSALIAAGVSI